ncbi:Cof-type HAD-IIB family hydrolase [Dellaglioa carnosa]|uniref:Cof-type HAD-IIB family hydrolase n=1 Tax=Dellaglioa carnosa TaxID=2995136 RepID=UPI0022A89892|nr:Cof-type HAD-IIB family hydrolase [Dellaglioa carnosa]MCZ2492273.1 Cof-type HAD-IIB family hydrolase [Dellaglioa carnosa]
MTVKIIAVDLDGTFLRDDKTFDEVRFNRQMVAMKNKGIHFVVASGNQVMKIKDIFKRISGDIGYVSDNGAVIYDGEEHIRSFNIDPIVYEETISYIQKISPSYGILASTDQSGYIDARESDKFVEMANLYYPNIVKVPNLSKVDKIISKVTINGPLDEYKKFAIELKENVDDSLVAKVSGFGFIDINVKEATKRNGLNALQELWHIQDDEVLTVGDNDNDAEMLEYTPLSFAMAKASETAAKMANHRIGSNQDDSVLDLIDDVLAGKY